MVGLASWYKSRPKAPGPWNMSALKGTWNGLYTEGDQRTAVFRYILENKTEVAYKVDSGMIIMSRLAREDSLAPLKPAC
jgi:hypothetical protein